MNEKIILYLDMDGFMASWEDFDIPKEIFSKPEFFLKLEPEKNVIDAVKLLTQNHSDEIEIRSLSVAMNRECAVAKTQWLDKYLPEIPAERRFFPLNVYPHYGIKWPYMVNGARCMLIDDHTNHLEEWRAHGGLAVKFLNGQNGLLGKWNGDFISWRTKGDCLAETIYWLAHKAQPCSIPAEMVDELRF